MALKFTVKPLTLTLDGTDAAPADAAPLPTTPITPTADTVATASRERLALRFLR